MAINHTEVNGTAFDAYSFMDTSTARKFAADLARAEPTVEKVSNCAGHDAEVKLASELPDCQTFRLPDGWEIDHINVTTGGRSFLYIDRVEADDE